MNDGIAMTEDECAACNLGVSDAKHNIKTAKFGGLTTSSFSKDFNNHLLSFYVMGYNWYVLKGKNEKEKEKLLQKYKERQEKLEGINCTSDHCVSKKYAKLELLKEIISDLKK